MADKSTFARAISCYRSSIARQQCGTAAMAVRSCRHYGLAVAQIRGTHCVEKYGKLVRLYRDTAQTSSKALSKSLG